MFMKAVLRISVKDPRRGNSLKVLLYRLPMAAVSLDSHEWIPPAKRWQTCLCDKTADSHSEVSRYSEDS